MTNIEALKALYGYPVPDEQIKVICIQRGLTYFGDASIVVMESERFQLAKADVLKWIASSPNIKEGDISISLGSDDRKVLMQTANAIYSKYEIEEGRVVFGYKGEDL